MRNKSFGHRSKYPTLIARNMSFTLKNAHAVLYRTWTLRMHPNGTRFGSLIGTGSVNRTTTQHVQHNRTTHVIYESTVAFTVALKVYNLKKLSCNMRTTERSPQGDPPASGNIRGIQPYNSYKTDKESKSCQTYIQSMQLIHIIHILSITHTKRKHITDDANYTNNMNN